MSTDPRVKLLIIATFSTMSVLATDIVYLVFLFISIVFLDIVMKINIFSALKRLRFLLSLILFIVIMQSLFIKGGAVLINIGKLSLITSEGLVKGGEFALRMGIIIFASLVVMKSNAREMIDGLIKMKVPYEIAFMTSIAIRFLPQFKNEFTTRLNAVAIRGINIKKLSFKKKIKLYSYIIFPTVSGSIIKSKELALAMEVRAFRVYKKRTMLREYKLQLFDYLFIIFIIAYTLIFLYFMYTKGAIL